MHEVWVHGSAFSGSAARAGNKARCGLWAATRSKSPETNGSFVEGNTVHSGLDGRITTFSSTKIFQENKWVKTNGENPFFCGENGPNLQLFVGYLSYLHQMKLMSQLAACPPVATAAT